MHTLQLFHSPGQAKKNGAPNSCLIPKGLNLGSKNNTLKQDINQTLCLSLGMIEHGLYIILDLTNQILDIDLYQNKLFIMVSSNPRWCFVCCFSIVIFFLYLLMILFFSFFKWIICNFPIVALHGMRMDNQFFIHVYNFSSTFMEALVNIPIVRLPGIIPTP